ncbi:hypothetical protein MJS38_06450, partial [Burkholderia gladioli]
MTDEQQQPTTEITQAVADSNAATVASLSTSISGTEANAGAVSASADAVPLSTSTAASQEAGGAVAGEPIGDGGAAASAPTASPMSTASVAPTAESDSSIMDPLPAATDAPAVAQRGEPVANGSGSSEPLSTNDSSGTLSTAASTSSSADLATSLSGLMSADASRSSASIPESSAADATMADVGEQAEQQPEAEHPAKPHIRGFLRKIEAGEAIVLADVEAVLRRLEEVL